MDLATIVGLIVGIGSIVFSVVSSAGMSGFAQFIDVPSIVIVVGGTIAATLLSCSLKQFLSIFSIAKHVFSQNQISNDEVISKIQELGAKARKEGLLELEKVVENEEDEFLKKSLLMAIDGINVDTLKNTLTNEIDCLRLRHAQSQGIFEILAEQFPSWGMIGTLIGLVLLLSNLDDPSTIGPSMAVAILTTLYGSIFANFLCKPIAKKLEMKSAEEALRRELIIEGVICISKNESSLVTEQKLKSFLSNSQKKELEQLEK